ncbi:PucR family transcriptional regulator [Leucobacter luti]|uniref:Purine catabolism regulator n=1 Tax=Leucobacter luti TaxID=340320 RepID=A0A4Q7U5W0_9MICO|nr:PucR family transcriptional regulator [Leucobacter luti]MBL3700653.1 PucR family transcriptional regulator [Leucobacter luti]RZT68507.1 purine catabolism regulator [Leucobacter luti]
MAVLSDMLALPQLNLQLVQSGPGDPEISWVSTTELLDLGAYLEGGEIILTTGLSLEADDPRWRDFVASLSRARVAAIGFGVGVNHERIPPPLLSAASAYRVALFEVPLPVPFIAVSKAMAELIRADELRAARGALLAQQRILDGARGEQDPADVLASLAQATGKHLALLASDGAVLASTAGFANADGPTGGNGLAARETIDLDVDGSLRLAVAGSTPLTPEGRSVLAAGSIVLWLGLRGAGAEERRERERWERFTWAILTETTPVSTTEILSTRVRLPERVRAVAVQGTAEDVADWRRRPRTGLERLITPGAAPPGIPGLALAWQLCADTPAATERALEIAAEYGLDAVVGRSAASTEAGLSRRSAHARLRGLSPTAPLYAAPRVPQVIWADRDTPLLEVLFALDQPASAGPAANGAGGNGGNGATAVGAGGNGAAANGVGALSARVLGPLSRTGTGLPEAERALLRDTLRCVYDADGQRGPAASALGIHRNTLRDRILRIERLTERSLADADDRAELWFALRIEDLSGGGSRG